MDVFAISLINGIYSRFLNLCKSKLPDMEIWYLFEIVLDPSFPRWKFKAMALAFFGPGLQQGGECFCNWVGTCVNLSVCLRM